MLGLPFDPWQLVAIGLAIVAGMFSKHQMASFDHKSFGMFVQVAIGQFMAYFANADGYTLDAALHAWEGVEVTAASVSLHSLGKMAMRLLPMIFAKIVH